MITSRTTTHSVTADQETRDGDVAVWVRPLSGHPDTYTLEEIEALAVRGVVRELLAEERRQA